VKGIFVTVAIAAVIFVAGCSSFQGNERVSQQQRKAVLKAADESDPDNVDISLHQNIRTKETRNIKRGIYIIPNDLRKIYTINKQQN
jgi:hypothetical protein